MRIVIATQDAPIYLPEFLDLFFKNLDKNICVCAIIILPSHQRGLFDLVKNYFALYGLKSFVVFFLKVLGQKIKGRTVVKISQKHQIKIIRQDKIIANSFRNFAKENKIDLLVSVASPQIFSKNIFSAPKYGAINYHSSLLPKYRGRMPLFWALFHNEKYCGVTVHQIARRLDGGKILAQEKIKISAQDSLDDLYQKTIRSGAPLLAKVIGNLDYYSDNASPQKHSQKNTYAFPTPTDSVLFRKNHRFF